MAAPAVSVILTTYGGTALLVETLAEVRRQADDLGAEVLLVVNRRPGELPAEQVAAWEPQVEELLYEEEPGQSSALNAGIRAARGACLAFTDDDALPAPGWLERITAPLRAGEAAGAGGRVWPVYPEGGPPRWYRHLAGGRETWFLGPLHDLGPQAADYGRSKRLITPIGANSAYRKEQLGAVPYRPELGPNLATGMRGGADVELGRRLLRAGRRLRYCPGAVVYHPVARSRMEPAFLRDSFFRQGLEAVRLARLLGRPLPSARKLHRKRARLRARIAAGAALPGARRVRQRLLLHYCRGQLAGLEGDQP